jgi:kelch-like protein 1/4/5
MHKKRGAVAVTALNGYVYAVGGHEGPTTLVNYNRFDCAERFFIKYYNNKKFNLN